MKPKQLANVLVKILGLSLIAHGIPNLIATLIGAVRFVSENRGFGYSSYDARWSLLLFGLPPLVIGFALIVGSRWLVEKLIEDEAE